jgi:xanthine/CO dehydrogenase XdhC/CoxF family maturation factor
MFQHDAIRLGFSDTAVDEVVAKLTRVARPGTGHIRLALNGQPLQSERRIPRLGKEDCLVAESELLSVTPFRARAVEPPRLAVENDHLCVHPVVKRFEFQVSETTVNLELDEMATVATTRVKLGETLGVDPALIRLFSQGRLLLDAARIWGSAGLPIVLHVISADAAVAIAAHAAIGDVPMLPKGRDFPDDDAFDALKTKLLTEIGHEELVQLQAVKPSGIDDFHAVLIYLQCGRDVGLAKNNF